MDLTSDTIGDLKYKVIADLQQVDRDIADIQRRFDAKPIKLKFSIDESSVRDVQRRLQVSIGMGAMGGMGGASAGASASATGQNQQLAIMPSFAGVLGSSFASPMQVGGGVVTAPGKLCPTCGAVVPAGAQFCRSCGTNIGSFAQNHPYANAAVNVAGFGAQAGWTGATFGARVGAKVGKFGMGMAWKGVKLADRMIFGSDTTLNDLFDLQVAQGGITNQHLANISNNMGSGPSADDIGASVASSIAASGLVSGRPRRRRRRGNIMMDPPYGLSPIEAMLAELSAHYAGDPESLDNLWGLGRGGGGGGGSGGGGSGGGGSGGGGSGGGGGEEGGPSALAIYQQFGRRSGQTRLFGDVFSAVGAGAAVVGTSVGRLAALAGRGISSIASSPLARYGGAYGYFELANSSYKLAQSHATSNLLGSTMGYNVQQQSEAAQIQANYDKYMSNPISNIGMQLLSGVGAIDNPKEAYKTLLQAKAQATRGALHFSDKMEERATNLEAAGTFYGVAADPHKRAEFAIGVDYENRQEALRQRVRAYTEASTGPKSREIAEGMMTTGTAANQRLAGAQQFVAAYAESGRHRNADNYAEHIGSSTDALELSNVGRYHASEVEATFGDAQEHIRSVRYDPNLSIEEKDKLIDKYTRYGTASLVAVKRRIDMAMHGGVAEDPGNFINYANLSARDTLPQEDLTEALKMVKNRTEDVQASGRREADDTYDDRRAAIRMGKETGNAQVFTDMLATLNTIAQNIQKALTAQ